jgi:hypothetical protein
MRRSFTWLRVLSIANRSLNKAYTTACPEACSSVTTIHCPSSGFRPTNKTGLRAVVTDISEATTVSSDMGTDVAQLSPTKPVKNRQSTSGFIEFIFLGVLRNDELPSGEAAREAIVSDLCVFSSQTEESFS